MKYQTCLTIALLLSTIGTPAIAQTIIPDNTLGVESSIVQPRNGFDGITGGATRTTGLFHSFSQFDVSNTGAYFLVRPEIQHIFARVTGNQASTINGPIGTKIDNVELSPSSASLFLLNPNGIIFGPNAKLDLGGSFLATTASGFKFAGGQEFSAVNPQTAPLLTVSVPIGLQFGQKVGGIETNGANLLPATDAKSLSLIGGDVKITNSRLSAITGQLDVGAVGAGESVGLTALPIGWKVDYTSVRNFQDIQIDRSQISPGAVKVADFAVFPIDLQLQGKRINITNKSNLSYRYEGVNTKNLTSGKIRLIASEAIGLNNSTIFTNSDGTIPTPGIEINTGTLKLSNNSTIFIAPNGGVAGNVEISASQNILLQDGAEGISQIGSANDSQGNILGGAINITAPSLEIYGGSRLNTAVFTKGKAGDINLKVDRLVVAGERENQSAISSFSGGNSIGDTGSINIVAGTVNLLDGGIIAIGRFGQGKPGTIDLQVKGAIVVSGATAKGLRSTISHLQGNQLSTDRILTPGINIVAARLLLENGGNVSTSALFDGDALGIDIQVDEDVTIRGAVLKSQIFNSDGDPIFSESAISSSKLRGAGSGGDIQIRAKTVQLLEGGSIESEIDRLLSEAAREVVQGKSGDILITASDRVIVSGRETQSSSSKFDFFSPSNISNTVFPSSNAQGGKILIQTGSLQVLAGAQIESDTLGRGQAGTVEVNALGDVTVAGSGNDGFSSSISSLASFRSRGNAGSVILNAGSLNLLDSGSLTTTTFGAGNAGSIVVNVRGDIAIVGQSNKALASAISSSSAALTKEQLVDIDNRFGGDRSTIIPPDQLGNGGKIMVTGNSLRIDNDGFITARSTGGGQAGTITVNLRDRLILNNSEIRTASQQTSGGNIDLTAKVILLRNNANIKTNIASGTGRGGNITLTAPSGIVLLDDSDILAFAQDGRGGNISLSTPALLTRTYKPSASGSDLKTLDTNGFVDINATGATSGIIAIPSLNPLQNNRPALPNNLIDPTNQLDRSCLARNPQTGKFYITGAGGIPPQPGDPTLSNYSTLPVASETLSAQINEADGIYSLDNGQRVFGRICQG